MNSSKLSYVKVWKLVIFCCVLIASGLSSLSGCAAQQKPSFIIVALDRLSFNSFPCLDEKSAQNSGFSTLCKEAMRFTHAYTTSVQPAAAMGSLLTGSYPYVHGLHRSFDRIYSKEKLLSEIADHQGYRTSFFSGSPTIMKKTGLAKGFDLFDDLSFLDKKNYMSTFKRQADLALNWMIEDKHPFLTVIYNSELESVNDSESENTTFEKLDENLAAFFTSLKDRNLWESSYVIVLGLQGVSDYSRPGETMMSNLHSENTNISLFVKPPRQKGDDGMNWKVDSFINTADLGWSLIKTLDKNYLKPADTIFSVVDFSYLWNDKPTLENHELPNRKILIEATNPWAEDTETRFAVLLGHLLFIENQADELFNTLNDGLETIDISSSATSAQQDFKNENRKLANTIRENTQQNPWTHYKTDVDEWVAANRDYWTEPHERTRIFEDEIRRFEKTRIRQPLTSLLFHHLYVTNKTDVLKQLRLKLETPRPSTERDAYFEESRRQSLNLALENIWGLWGKNKTWNQSTVIKEYQ